MTTTKTALTVSQKNSNTLNLSFGISKLQLLKDQRSQSIADLSNTARNMLRQINFEEIYDCEIGTSEGQEFLSIGIYLLEFNGEFNGYEVTKLRMIDSLLSLTADAINKAEAESKDKTVLSKTEYIKFISSFIHKEAKNLSANMSIMCESYILARLDALVPDNSFKENLAISYFDRFLAVTDALSAEYWAGTCDSIINSSLYNADTVLRRVAAELGLYEVNYDNSGRQIGFGELVVSNNENAVA